MIDIHSHILPGLDDGAATIEESLAMLRMAAAAGTTDIVATPHANPEFAFDPDRVSRGIAELRSGASDIPRIHYGCDFHLSPENIEDALRTPTKYAINHRSYLLVEFSERSIPKTTRQTFSAMLDAGIRPVITHPERNLLLQKRLGELESWVESGCFVQVTAQSLLGLFGSRAREFSHLLMNRNLVHFLASDAHDLERRTTVLQPAWDYVAEQFGAATAQRLLSENPQAALEGAPLAFRWQPTPKKRWFSFF
jgi:protein-tyrosine phosphatase